MSDGNESLEGAREEFISQWGVLGSAWGINRTMAQIHALLMTNHESMSTDEVMERLHISRGNAHTNLKELVGWGLLRIVTRKGDRKEYFESEKDVWKMFTIITRERKRREIDPALDVLRNCTEQTKNIDTLEGKIFHDQLKELQRFVSFASKIGDKVGNMNYTPAMKLAEKLLG